jgi:hypothetical protein
MVDEDWDRLWLDIFLLFYFNVTSETINVKKKTVDCKM